jgi:hypothetical protein
MGQVNFFFKNTMNILWVKNNKKSNKNHKKKRSGGGVKIKM